VVLHKGLTDESIDRATQALRAEGVGYYFYVMVGKPYMTVAEDLADTIATVNYAFELGGSMVVLEMINVQPHTLTKVLYARGVYRPPAIWLGIEVLRHLKPQYRHLVPIKGYEKAEPMPEVFPDTCNSCRDRVRSALREWNLRRNWHDLERTTKMCECRREFEDRIAQGVPTEPLWERVEAALDSLIEEVDGASGA